MTTKIEFSNEHFVLFSPEWGGCRSRLEPQSEADIRKGDWIHDTFEANEWFARVGNNEWEGPFRTRKAAEEFIIDAYGLDPITGEEFTGHEG